MMSNCLSNSLSMEAKVRLLTYQNDYTFNGVEYAPLMYKVIMRLATIDLIATTQTLRDNLQNLGVFAATVNGDIDKIHSEFDQNNSQIIAQWATVNDPIGIIFEAYSIVSCYNFTPILRGSMTSTLTGNLPTPMKLSWPWQRPGWITSSSRASGEQNPPTMRRSWPWQLRSLPHQELGNNDPQDGSLAPKRKTSRCSMQKSQEIQETS